ncbi:hypothetical protein LRP52_49860, partial [Photobacterium sp. ZSDE20]|nr:hypothetical protein [Photobacterium sp. ZSDE20]
MKWKFVTGAAVVASLLLPRAPLGLHLIDSKVAEKVQEALGKTHLVSYIDSTSSIDYVAGTISSEYILRDQDGNNYTVASITKVGLSELTFFAKAFPRDGENSIIDASTDEVYADAIAKAGIFSGDLIADIELTPFAFSDTSDISVSVP